MREDNVNSRIVSHFECIGFTKTVTADANMDRYKRSVQNQTIKRGYM
jgi:hypothetical protein